MGGTKNFIKKKKKKKKKEYKKKHAESSNFIVILHRRFLYINIRPEDTLKYNTHDRKEKLRGKGKMFKY